MARAISKIPSEAHQALKNVRGYSYGAILGITQRAFCWRLQGANLCIGCEICEKVLVALAQDASKEFDLRRGNIAGFWTYKMKKAAEDIIENRPRHTPTPHMNMEDMKVV